MWMPNREKRGKRGAKIDSAGYDAGKKIKGKKRQTAVDTLGLLINFAVSPGYVQDRNMIAPLLAIASKRFPSLEKAIADGGYQGKPTADGVKRSMASPINHAHSL